MYTYTHIFVYVGAFRMDEKIRELAGAVVRIGGNDLSDDKGIHPYIYVCMYVHDIH
jgi:hypothetical protein